MSKFRDYCYALYDHLNASATDGVYTGTIRAACDAVKIPGHYRSQVIRQLYDLESIEQLQRGSGVIPTQLRIVTRPPEGRWPRRNPADHLTTAADFATLAGEVRDIQTRLGSLNIAQALYELSERVGAIERKLNKNQGEN